MSTETKIENNQDILESIKNQIETFRVVLYMKGTKEQPRCGFSAQVVKILNTYGALDNDALVVNVLDDDQVREGIKQFSDWPTIPQLYVEGIFIGGCDIVSDLYKTKELDSILSKNN